MNFFDNHKSLFTAATILFIVLTLWVCILPAVHNQQNIEPLPNAEPLSEAAIKGKAIYISEGCVACHTQQVRNIDMDKSWGARPSVAADYAAIHRTDFWRNTATLMGTERTGPDLTNIGLRQPSIDWQLTHLFNPRAVVRESIMPAYPWLFTFKENPDIGDMVVNVPDEYLGDRKGKVIATPDAIHLVAYLQSLKQTKLPDGTPEPNFLYPRKLSSAGNPGAEEAALDGAALYVSNCQSCHQPNGEGLKGAFPPLKGSKIVLDNNPELMVEIIMNGYNGREQEGFGAMPAIGTNNNLTASEVAAIMNHEKTSWGNDAKEVTAKEVEKILTLIKQKP